MFVEQTEFELGSPGLLLVHVTLELIIFKTKQRPPKKSSSELLLTAKNIAVGNVPCFFSPVPYQLQIYPKMLGVKREL